LAEFDVALFYDKLIDLVEKSTAATVQMVENQKELKAAQDEILVALSAMGEVDYAKLRTVCDDISVLLHSDDAKFLDSARKFRVLFDDEDYKLMSLIKDLRESNITKIARNAVIAVVTFAGVVGLFEVGTKLAAVFKMFGGK
jgi:hypothetical protein